jgi:hypothetical protein
MPNKELKLYVPEETVRALEKAAETVEGYSRNEIAVDVIRQCLPIWLAAREAFDGVMEDFLRRTIDQARERRIARKN